MMTSLDFETITPGLTLESEAHVVTEEEIDAFARLSGDFHPLHMDEAYAAKTPFGTRIAHGLLILSIATGLLTRIGFVAETLEAFLGLEWKFRAPVRIGDAIRVRVRVKRKRTMPDYQGGLVTLAVSILNQRDEVVQRGTWNVLVRSGEGTSV